MQFPRVNLVALVGILLHSIFLKKKKRKKKRALNTPHNRWLTALAEHCNYCLWTHILYINNNGQLRWVLCWGVLVTQCADEHVTTDQERPARPRRSNKPEGFGVFFFSWRDGFRLFLCVAWWVVIVLRAQRPPEFNPDKSPSPSPSFLLPVNKLLCILNYLYKSVHAADASGHIGLQDVCVAISNVGATMKISPIKVYMREF